MRNSFYVEMISQRVVLNNEQIHICDNLCEMAAGMRSLYVGISGPILKDILAQAYKEAKVIICDD
jgi:hypothetical protein